MKRASTSPFKLSNISAGFTSNFLSRWQLRGQRTNLDMLGYHSACDRDGTGTECRACEELAGRISASGVQRFGSLTHDVEIARAREKAISSLSCDLPHYTETNQVV